MHHRTRLFAGIGAAACLAVGGACTDAPTAPRAAWVAVETEAALRIDEAVPTLPRLIERARARRGDRSSDDVRPVAAGDAALERASALWRSVEAAKVDDPEARRTRDRAYRLAAEPLAAALGADTVASLRAELEAWVEAAGELDSPRRFPEATAGLVSARAWLDRARTLGGRGDRTAEVVALMHAAERVAELTPTAVARRLLTRAEAAVDATAAGDRRDVGARTVRRAERLVAGARDALDGDDPIRAIRRAYYATRLLDPR